MLVIKNQKYIHKIFKLGLYYNYKKELLSKNNNIIEN